MKQYYSVENFKAINYGDKILSIPVTLNKCAINNILVILDRWSISFNCIEYIVFNSNAQEQLILYIFYEKKNKKHNEIIKVKIEDFDDLRGDWVDFIGEMFMMALVNKEEEGSDGTCNYCD